MDNKPTPNDQPGKTPVMDVKAPNANDTSMADDGSSAIKTPEIAPAGGAPTNPLAAPTPDATKDGQSATQPVPIKKSGKKVKIILILLIAVVLAGAAVYLYLSKKDDTTTTTTPVPAVTTETTASQDVQDAATEVDNTIQAADGAGDTTDADLTDSTLGL